MKVLVIGGTGHIGGYLVPRLVAAGHEVVVVSRGVTAQAKSGDWKEVEFEVASYARDDGPWRELVAGQAAEVVVDIMGTDVPGTYEAAKGKCEHFVACGSLWMYGEPKVVPTPEVRQGVCEFAGYAQRYDEMLATLEQAGKDGIAFSGVMPPNICGPGKIPLDCLGGRSVDEHKRYARGEAVTLAAGCNTLIGPCDASDIANAFLLAVQRPDAAAGHIFNVGAAYSLTAMEFVRAYGVIYGKDIAVEFVEYEKYYRDVLPEAGANFHFRSHMQPDISKIRARLGHEPEFTPEETMARAVDWMRQEGMV